MANPKETEMQRTIREAVAMVRDRRPEGQHVMTAFGDTLKQIRESRRGYARFLSQARLAERAGFDHSYVSRLESGTRMPTRGTVQALADELDATPEERTQLLEAAGFFGELPKDVERFRALPEERRRLLLEISDMMERGAA